ncbi:hypothetical protein PsorP6_007159 [Peronosclerospora sorghi]|uniref:Uncharacterized protein n=1 Tax=Peronosclerospora sorghi TaxID=230839 RepID=A0ACC0W707_9STRA|nr:hypothetical protein PsorP6_007159 [Peronosclerospora sorghi]
MLAILLGVSLLVFVAVSLLVAFVIITWEHDIGQTYAALPAPADLGTREFRWRCWLSPLTRRGWQTTILRSPCPRITLQCPFALVSADFAKLATSLSVPKLALDQLPFLFPQVAIGSLFLQLFGNSHFPASVRSMRLKALTVVQLRPLNMSFPAQDGHIARAPELTCIMVLTEKRFLETELEFTVQTDLLDEEGTVWQSVTWFAIPFKQETLVVPLSVSLSGLDEDLQSRATTNLLVDTFACSKRNLTEFEEVSVVGVTGMHANKKDIVPLMWILARATVMLQQQDRVPQLPLMCNCMFEEDFDLLPLQQKVRLQSWSSETETPSQREVIKFTVDDDGVSAMTGLLRTVGWVYPGQEDEGGKI